jgi:A1 cistron-splicing factor AAR2
MDDRVAALSQAEALELTRNAGTILCLEVPAEFDFGIDLHSYRVGPRFKGIKMVPTVCVHLITWGSELTACGMFVELEEAGVHALAWDPREEALSSVTDADDVERLAHEVRCMEHDAALGPYPLSMETQWRALSGYVSERVLRRAQIPLGTSVAPGGIDDEELEKELRRAGAQQPEHSLAGPPTRAQARAAGQWTGTLVDAPQAATFVELDPRRSGRGRSGPALSSFHLDRTEWLLELLRTHYSDDAECAADEASGAAEAALLGELQLAYLLFMGLSSLRALEQWKGLLQLLCNCDEALQSRASLYTKLLPILRAQLALAPADFLNEGGGAEGANFLRASLAGLAERTDAGGGAASLDARLADELQRTWTFVRMQFGISREALLLEAAGGDEDEPVVVETSHT